MNADQTAPNLEPFPLRPEPPRINRIAGAASTIFIGALSSMIGYAGWTSFTEHEAAGIASVVILFAGCLYGLGVGTAIRRASRPIWGAVAACTVVLSLAALPASAAMGRVTHSSFGLTVYGVVPIPLADLTFGADGAIRLRDKSHRITAEEIETLRRDGAELVIIAIGWESRARVDEQLTIDETVMVLPTGEAIDAYNRAKADGRRVALLAHTTC